MAEEQIKDNKSNSIKYILIFIIFLVIGVGVGIFGASKYLNNKKDNTPEESLPEIKDITNDSVYQETINDLYSIVNTNSFFYNSKGVTMSSLTNDSKLTLLYNYMVSKNMYTKESLNKIDNTMCENGFILDSTNANIPALVCTVYKIKKSDLVNVSGKIYNDKTIDTNNNFSPMNGRSCISSGDTYICGNTAAQSTGSLEIKFDIQKVNLTPDGYIEIYDKGYLADRRAGVDNPNDQYDNYYLHTSDSTNYYYELKSADNVTFKHTFKTDDNTNYYYVSTEVYNG